MTYISDSDGFDPRKLSEFFHLTPDELVAQEEEISKEFSSLARQYVKSRLSRIDHMINLLGIYIKKFNDFDKTWSKIYGLEEKTLHQIRTSTEDLILSNKLMSPSSIINKVNEDENELLEILVNIQYPLELVNDFDVNDGSGFELPFKEHLDKVIRPYIHDLKSVEKERLYQSDLIDSVVTTNMEVIWNQYSRGLIDYKEQLIEETCKQLQSLNNEYHHISHNFLNQEDWKNYYRSVVRDSQMEASLASSEDQSAANNHDKFYDTDNIYCKNNRIELTNYRRRILSQLQFFKLSQELHGSKDNPNEKHLLNTYVGLSENEIDSDLVLLRSGIENKHNMDDFVNYETKEPQSPVKHHISEELLHLKYRKLLGLPSDQTKNIHSSDNDVDQGPLDITHFRLPSIPPLEAFPPLKNKD
ncbi:Piso0_005059 [Millerozyma farinosa CBS 7064]|uniref:Piso0_005059 protein n=1 Tax=Pichia sorbitophila (strain ATCC MYA-4447 / BCRC 22081 / CBS 7064 / NBRC 10061 / NRRL Y-12695) TaxID=559304 RepID=G8Y445_PICSO|nr:Piso0_005059 [Millerozyma farinosa CBS 7064]